MSSINTNGINVNYPVPGQNNSTQGFRDNFANIKQNLNTASTEITDLQNKVLLKQALANSTLNNDMAGALISNATTLGFRASTYNLGNALSGTVLVDTSLGDVQYGNIAANTSFQFGNWAPINTESSIILNLGISNANAVITFPSEVVTNPGGYGVNVLENYKSINDVSTVTAPSNVSVLSYRLSTLDCGNTIQVTPLNRSYQTTQINSSVPPSTGQIGDMSGAVSIGPQVEQVSILQTSNTNVVINSAKVLLNDCTISGTTLTVYDIDYADMKNCYIEGDELFVGYLEYGNIQIGMQLSGSNVIGGTTIVGFINSVGGSSSWKIDPPQTVAAGTNIFGDAFIQNGMLISGPGILANTYIVSNDINNVENSVWTISQNHSSTGNISAVTQTGIVGDILYVGAVESGEVQVGARLIGDDILDNTVILSYNDTNTYFVSNEQYVAPNTIIGQRDAITCNSTALFYADMPIVFTGNVFGNLMPGVIYYVKDLMTSTDFSVTLTPGGNGTTYVLDSELGLMFGNPINYMYICSQDYNGVQIGPKNVLNTYSTTNYIKLDNVVGLLENSPIRFAGQVIGNLSADSWYYIKEIDSGNANISLSLTKVNGVAGSVLEMPTANAAGANTCQAYSIVGSDIWRQIPLIPNYNQSNIAAASLTIADTLNVQGNASVLGNLNVAGTVTYEQAEYNSLYAEDGEFENIIANNISSNTLTVTGLVTFDSNANFKLQGGTSGQYLQTDGTGNLVWADGTATPGSDSAGGSNTQVQFNDDNVLTGKAGFEFDTASDVLTIPGDLVANNANNTIVTNNAVISNTLTANTGVVALPEVANLTIDGGTAGYYLQSNGAGGLVWAAGTGTLTGNGTANGIQYAIQYSAGDGNFLANSDFTFSNANANLSVPGNINLTGNVVSDGGIFADGTISGTLLIGTLNAGSSSQPNITSVGTLTSLAVNGTVNANALFANTGTTIDPDNVSGFAAGKIVQSGFYAAPGKPGIVIGNSAGQHGAIVYDSTAPGLVFGTESGSANTMAARARLFSNNTFKVDYLDGTLLTGIQPYITKVGTLSSLGVVGNVNAANFVGSLANGVSSVKIPVASGNVNISAYGNANVLVVTGTGINVNGNVQLSGNVSSNGNGAGIISSFLNTSGNSYGNLDVSAEIGNGVGIRALAATFTDTVASATSAITMAAAHALAAPVLDAANTNVTLDKAATFAIMGEPDNGANTTLNPANAYALYANGKVYVDGNITSTGLLNAANINLTSNLTTQNLSVLDTAVFSSVSSVEIPGGSMGYFLQTDGLGNLTWAPGTVTASGTGTSYGINDLIQVSNGVGGFNAYSGFSYNGSNLSVPGNVVASNGLYGTIRTAAQPNITSVGALTSLTVVGNMSVVSIGSGITSRYISVTNSMTGNANTNDMSLAGGLGFRTFPTTYTTNNPTGTVNEAAIHVISQPTVAGSNTGTILANASTLLIKGAPTGTGANMTITNAYALTVQGNAKFTGVSTFTGNVSACANVIFANVESIKVGNTTSYAGYYLQTDGANNLQWAQGTIDAISSPGGANTQVQFNDNTVLAGSANFVFDKTSGNLTLNGNGNITGNLTVGNVIYNNSKGTAGQILTIYGNGLTYWSTVGSGSGISNGSSNISVVTSAGNINVYPTSSYTNLLGNTISLGNFRVGASWGTAVQYANTRPTSDGESLLGYANGITYWGIPNELSNGGSSLITFNSTSGNIEFDVGATTNVMSIASGGVTINDGPLTVGAVKYTNTWTVADAGKVLKVYANGLTYWDAVGGSGTSSVISNGTSSVSIPAAAGNVNISVGGTANILVVKTSGGTGANITGNLDVSQNVNASSIIATSSLQVGTGTGPTGNVQYIGQRGSGNGYVLAINTSTGATYWKDVSTGASSIAYTTAIVDITSSGNVRLRPSVLTTGGGKVVIETNTGGSTDVVVNGDVKPSGNVVAGGKLQAGTIIYTNVVPVDTVNRYLKLNSDLTTSWATIPTSGGGGGGSYINNGASNVYIGSSDGPITANVNGAQIAIIKSTGIETTRTVKIGDVVYTNVAGTGNEGKFLKLGPGGSTFWDFASGSGSTTPPTKIEQGGGKVEALTDGSLLLRPTDAAAGNILMSRSTGLLSANIVGNLNLQGVGGGYIKAKGFVFDAEAIVTTSGSITLNSTHNGRVIYIDSTSAATVTVTPAALPTGFSCVVIQGGTGQVTVSGASAVGGKNKSSGQYAVMTVLQVTASVAILSGDITT